MGDAMLAELEGRAEYDEFLDSSIEELLSEFVSARRAREILTEIEGGHTTFKPLDRGRTGCVGIGGRSRELYPIRKPLTSHPDD